MALFEKTCACCGKSANVLTRLTLADGKTLCRKCLEAVPSYFHEGLKEGTIETYQYLRKYAAYSASTIKPRFRETHKYYGLRLDANNGYLCIKDLASSFVTEELYLQVEDVELDMLYDPETYKDGFLAETVNGDVKVSIELLEPAIECQAILKKKVKADAHKKTGLFKDKVTYQNPKGQDEFLARFKEARLAYLTAILNGTYHGRYAG